MHSVALYMYYTLRRWWWFWHNVIIFSPTWPPTSNTSMQLPILTAYNCLHYEGCFWLTKLDIPEIFRIEWFWPILSLFSHCQSYSQCLYYVLSLDLSYLLLKSCMWYVIIIHTMEDLCCLKRRKLKVPTKNVILNVIIIKTATSCYCWGLGLGKFG